MTVYPTPEAQPYLLDNTIQHYAWGTKNKNAFIPALLNQPIEKDRPYAELWIGAHPKAPSMVLIEDEKIPLNEWIEAFPEAIMGKAAGGFANLPFLFKVLSAGQALSIQAHPDKKQAEQLHQRDPEHYPDDNHKPEIAIAIDALTALAGFRPLKEIRSMLNAYPEISVFMGLHTAESVDTLIQNPRQSEENILRELYTVLLKQSLKAPDQLLSAIQSLKRRLQHQSVLTEQDQLFLKLTTLYPDADIGLFSLYLFNLIHLEKGQGIFLEAGIPHAYLEGNIVECMANSDNVIRAGLTPKFKDIETLMTMAQYKPGPLPVYTPDKSSDKVDYTVPIPEFSIIKRVIQGGQSVSMSGSRLTIGLVLEGAGTLEWEGRSMDVKTGTAFLLPACLPACVLTVCEALEIFEVCIPEAE